MLRYSVLLIAVLFGLQSVAPGEKAADLPKPTTYVSDFAGVIDAESKQKLEDLSRDVHVKAQTTIAVVTIKSLEGEPIEEFSTQLYDKWKIGAKGTDKGLLMIFAIAERKRRIEVGPGLQGILNDAKVGDIGRSMMPLLKEGQYGPAIFSGEQQIAAVVAADAGVTLDGPVQHTYRREVVRKRHSSSWIGVLAIMFFFFLFAIGRGRSRYGNYGYGGGSWLPWFLLGGLFGSGRNRPYGGDGSGFGGGYDGGGGSGGGSNDDFGSGFGGSSDGGGSSGDW